MRIIWFGEEDQLRIMCMKKGSDLLEVFTNLNQMLVTVEALDGLGFARDENYGYVTSCPSKLGTGMRALVHIKIPNLTKNVPMQRQRKSASLLGCRFVGREESIHLLGPTERSTSLRRLFYSSRRRKSLTSCTRALRS
jgi:protein-arginine kinase